MNQLVASLRRIIAEDKIDDIFFDAIYSWVDETGNSEDLESFIKKYPDYMGTVDKGMEHQPLYRAIMVPANVLSDIIEHGSDKEYRAYPSPFESWTTGHNIADEFFKYVKPDQYDRVFVTLKKNIPASERIVCIPCIESDHKWAGGEEEVITTVQMKTAKDIDKIRIRLPYKGYDGKLKDDGWQDVSIKDGLYWAVNHENLIEEAKDQGVIFSWKPK